VPKAFPAEFRADVIAVARKGEAPLHRIAKDFGNSEACLHRWLKIADREDGFDRSGAAATVGDESAELREARKRIKLLESKKSRSCAARSPTCRGMSTQNDVPAGPRPCR
jgi:transposase